MESVRLRGIPDAFRKTVQRPFRWFLFLCLTPLHSATLQQLSTTDLIVKSTAIVHGKVTGASAAFTNKIIYTHYSIQVTERFKGPAQTTLDVVVPGGTVGSLRQSFSGAPAFTVGGDYVFFLWTSRAGLTQVLGLTQGLFSVAQDGSSDPVATRTASRETMLDPVSGRPVKDQPVSMKMSQLRALIASTLGTQSGGNQ